jgi:predicted O-methyltransferase YrrM
MAPMPTLTTVQRFLAMASGNWVAASLYAAAVLGIADLLAEGPRSAGDLAEATQADPDALRRLLRMLAAHGVFAERGDGRFEQTELSTLLRDDAAGSLRSMLLMYGSEVWRVPWGEMVHSIRTGETAFSKMHGAELFEYMKRDGEFAATFNRAMTEGSARLAAEIVVAYDFSGFGTIVDVGGGQGWLLSAILRAVPAARGVLVDLPHVIETARALIGERGVADRCELVSGSFFESVPAGGDAYVLKWIIHDWNDADATRILRTVRAAVPRTGRLIVFDRVLPERVREGNPLDQSGTLMDLNMLVNVTGRERTEAEFRRLFAAAGFTLSSARSTPSGLGVVEGLPG